MHTVLVTFYVPTYYEDSFIMNKPEDPILNCKQERNWYIRISKECRVSMNLGKNLSIFGIP